MSVLLHTGAPVLPGDVIYAADVSVTRNSSGSSNKDDDDGSGMCMLVTWATRNAQDAVTAGEGCYLRLASAGADDGNSNKKTNSETSSDTRVYAVASRAGVVQWDGARISVYPRQRRCTATATAAAANAVAASSSGGDCVATVATQSFGPSPGDAAHVRITRVTRLFAFGDIVAVNGVWCSNNAHGMASGGGAGGGAFRGVLRVEDIRPFRPSKDALQPPAPSLAFQPGDVVVAQVLSQSDVRQYQLSTMPEHCGVVEAYVTHASAHDEDEQPSLTVTAPRGRQRLQHIPHRRDAMVDPVTHAVVPRWCPLVLSVNE